MERCLPAAPRRRLVVAFVSALFVTAVAMPGSAQMRMGMKDRILDDVANEMVSTIQSDSCSEFEAMLKKRKSGGSGKGSAMLKRDPAARVRFVNKVAGPMLNKMIDCDLLPGK